MAINFGYFFKESTSSMRRNMIGTTTNAAAEFADPASQVRVTIAEHRAWYRETMRQLASEIGSTDPDQAADDLVLLRDGAMISGYLGDADDTAAALTRAGRTVVARL